MVYICGLIPARIRRALVELPDTLDETYERTLREINKAEWEIAHRLFQFVSVSRRPLLVKELADLLAFDFEAGPIPKFHEDWRLDDPIDAVLSTCSSLLAIVDVNGSPVIQFSHFSVKEFLTSSRLAETRETIHRRFCHRALSLETVERALGDLRKLHLCADATTNANNRGGGGRRGGSNTTRNVKVGDLRVPTMDFDFEGSNALFDKTVAPPLSATTCGLSRRGW